jgi:hypothetical protein
MRTLVERIQAGLSADLLSKRWHQLVAPGDHPTTGHCYVAAEAAYYLYGKRRGFQPRVLRIGKGLTHWYLEHPSTGERIDPTAEQFEHPLDYTNGRRCPFLTKQPSKRTQVLLKRVS